MPEIVLYQFQGGDGQDSWSPFCTKVHRLLAFKGLAYAPKNVASPMELKRLNPGVGKVPVISYDGTFVPDSSRIARFVEERHAAPPFWPAGGRERALAQALEDWADESLYWFVVYERWNVDENFLPFAKRAFAGVPGPFRPMVRRMARGSSRKMLRGQGLGRLDRATMQGLLASHLDTLDALVQEGGWLVGDAPTLADIAAFAVVQGLHSTGLPASRAMVEERAAVVAWAKRLDDCTKGEHTAPWV